ncbi:MAG: WD40 repeat domain-containing protein [Thermodesulfobacteriota bacterium]
MHTIKKKILLISISILLFLGGCAVKGHVSEGTRGNIELNKGVHLVWDAVEGDGSTPLFWCGNSMFVVRGKNSALGLMNIWTGERVKISADKDDFPLDCTADGKWLVYMDLASKRADKKDGIATSGRERHVADLYRYEVATGKKQRFAAVRYSLHEREVVSPDGFKAFLGAGHDSAMEMPEPGWEALWFGNDWDHAGAVWFPDSSGVVSYGHNPNALFVELFGKGGRSRRFVLGPEYKGNIRKLATDKENRVYFELSEDSPDTLRLIYRCDIPDRNLACKRIFEHDETVSSYMILPDGDIVFNIDMDPCIRRISPPETRAECAAKKVYEDIMYDDITFIGTSPNGRWLAFESTKWVRSLEADFSHHSKGHFLVMEVANY